MAQKPWRPVQRSEETGRFTRRQIEDAVRAVKEENEARKKNGGHSGTAASSASKARSAPPARARSKSQA